MTKQEIREQIKSKYNISTGITLIRNGIRGDDIGLTKSAERQIVIISASGIENSTLATKGNKIATSKLAIEMNLLVQDLIN